MPKYEIMLIVDPNNFEESEKLTKEVFGNDVKKFEKLENTTLAYEINNTTTANYALIQVETDGQNIKEFTRRANISKAIWRNLVINLDSERAMDSLNAEIKPRGPRRPRRDERPSTKPAPKKTVTKETKEA